MTGTAVQRVVSGPLDELADFATGLDFAQLPKSLVEQAKLILQHNLVVMLAARHEAVQGQDRVEWPAAMPTAACATRVTDGARTPAELAVVTNSLAMGHRAQHDEHEGAVCHFGSTTVPPLLAAAEIGGVDGRTLLAAMVAGYEVGARIAKLSVKQTLARGFRPTSLYGPLAGATATSLILGLGRDELVTALAFAANSSAGITQAWLSGTDEWRYQTAFAARNGFTAARLAAEGVRGSPDTFDGARGFHRAFGGPDAIDPSVLDDLRSEWALNGVLLKPYPVCAFNQAPVQQALQLRMDNRVEPSEIGRIEVRMNDVDLRYPGVDTTAQITTRSQALMCLRTCTAIALLEGDVTLESLETPARDSIREVRDRVDVIADSAVASHTSSVRILLRNDVEFDSGAPRRVLYDDAVRAEMVDRLVPAGSRDRSVMQAVLDRVARLDGEDATSDVLGPLRA
jgi:2-methylcitrate dehydratase PrpD